jgi:hypothetical protein
MHGSFKRFYKQSTSNTPVKNSRNTRSSFYPMLKSSAPSSKTFRKLHSGKTGRFQTNAQSIAASTFIAAAVSMSP